MLEIIGSEKEDPGIDCKRIEGKISFVSGINHAPWDH